MNLTQHFSTAPFKASSEEGLMRHPFTHTRLSPHHGSCLLSCLSYFSNYCTFRFCTSFGIPREHRTTATQSAGLLHLISLTKGNMQRSHYFRHLPSCRRKFAVQTIKAFVLFLYLDNEDYYTFLALFDKFFLQQLTLSKII